MQLKTVEENTEIWYSDLIWKLGRCFSFLNKWYGFEHGGNHGNQYTVASEKVFNLPNNEPKSQKELAESYGITKQTMNNYIRMADMWVLH